MAITTLEARLLFTARDKTQKALKGARANLDQVGKAVTSVQSKVLALAGIGGMGAMISGIIRTNQEMQTLKSSLVTVTGSTEAAREAFKKLENFAITTPFDLNEWTQGFIKMKALGLDPSEAALTSYGNTAAAMGKSLNQMVEAVADAATGEFERLKEFGIRARKEGESIKFTFQGVTTEVANNADAITGYLQTIGNQNFGGAMADQMNNLTPAFSNMRQAFASLAVAIGEAGLNDMVIAMTRSITDFTNSFTEARLETIRSFFAGIRDAVGWIADIWNSITWLQGDGMLQQWQNSNPGQIGNMAPAVPGGYQLGDLNRSNANMDYLSVLKDIEAKRATGNDKAAAKIDETNQHLRDLIDISRDQRPAVAG